MREFRQYLLYLLRHKWYVFREAWRTGIPLLGMLHDLSKFLPDEWIPYQRYFYGTWPKNADLTMFEKMHFTIRTQEQVQAEFDETWLRHIHRNKHHWQYWVLREDSGATKALPMPWRYIREMIADWRGAGRAMGKGDNTVEWYRANKDKMLLHPHTRDSVEGVLGLRVRW